MSQHFKPKSRLEIDYILHGLTLYLLLGLLTYLRPLTQVLLVLVFQIITMVNITDKECLVGRLLFSSLLLSFL
jgi:hypothetical protein